MLNPLQIEFLSAVESALLDSTFRRLTLSARGKSPNNFKIAFELVMGGTKKLIRQTNEKSNNSPMTELDVGKFLQSLRGPVYAKFKAATLFTTRSNFHYAENRKGEPRTYSSKPMMRDEVQPHNRSKNYVLSKNRPYLRGLGVTNQNGEIVKKFYPKFRQIANFVEIIDRDIRDFVEHASHPISILDLGCGKGYLTFATYDYVASRAKLTPVGQGIDIKENVIGLCNGIADDVGFDGLEFINARIDKKQPENIDILVALHACDTATDDALALGVRASMEYVFCAPCCQAEISRQIGSAKTQFDIISQFPLMRRRQADLVTDTARALLLMTLGYEMKFLEFTPLEHTAKNLMLAGKKSEKVDCQNAWSQYQALKSASGFKSHSLENNLAELLP